MKAIDFDARFDEGESVLEHLELSTARRPGLDQKRVNVDMPTWMISDLDKEAERIGVSRQSVIKMWLFERLQSLKT